MHHNEIPMHVNQTSDVHSRFFPDEICNLVCIGVDLHFVGFYSVLHTSFGTAGGVFPYFDHFARIERKVRLLSNEKGDTE